MKQNEATIPPPYKIRLIEALERLVQLYEATGHKDKAKEWRDRLSEAKACAEAGGQAVNQVRIGFQERARAPLPERPVGCVARRCTTPFFHP